MGYSVDYVCPARAGMIRGDDGGRALLPCLPRTRGDDPDGTRYTLALGMFAPHARG